MDAKRWGMGGSNLSVHWTLTVRNSYFDSPLTHLFFVDDLKTYAQDEDGAKQQLDLITVFTADIGMEFGKDKCAYVFIDKGKQKSLGEKFSVEELELNELEDGEQYKYLGQDESVGYNNTLNKEKVFKKYFWRLRNIWYSELWAAFAVSLFRNYTKMNSGKRMREKMKENHLLAWIEKPRHDI